jgi:hypothetical protein
MISASQNAGADSRSQARLSVCSPRCARNTRGDVPVRYGHTAARQPHCADAVIGK